MLDIAACALGSNAAATAQWLLLLLSCAALSHAAVAAAVDVLMML